MILRQLMSAEGVACELRGVQMLSARYQQVGIAEMRWLTNSLESLHTIKHISGSVTSFSAGESPAKAQRTVRQRSQPDM